MKKTLLLAAALVMGLGSANAETEYTITLGNAITQNASLAENTDYIMYDAANPTSYVITEALTTGTTVLTTTTAPSATYTNEDFKKYIVQVKKNSDDGTFYIYFPYVGEGEYLPQVAQGSDQTDPYTTVAESSAYGYTVSDVTDTNGKAIAVLFQVGTTSMWVNSYAKKGYLSGNNGNGAYSRWSFKAITWTENEKTDYSEELKAAVGNYFTTNVGSYYAMSQTYYNTNKSTYDGYLEKGCTKDEYTAMKAAVEADVAKNVPATGYYRIYNNQENGRYLGAALNTNGDGQWLVYTTNTDYSSVIYLEKNEDGTYNIRANGLYAGTKSSDSDNNTVALGGTATKYAITAGAPGVVRIGVSTITDVGNKGFINAANAQIRLWGANYDTNGLSFWRIKDAAGDKFSVTMNTVDNSNYYATLYIPFTATTDVTASTISVNKDEEGNYTADPTDIKTICTGQGVLLSGTSATATLTVASSDQTSSSESANALVGTYVDVKSTEDTYVFSAVDNKVGFYNYTSGSTLGAYKAYMPKSVASDARGIILNVGETTGINAAQKAVENGKVYDLQGREVKTMHRGIYIINGKKVVK